MAQTPTSPNVANMSGRDIDAAIERVLPRVRGAEDRRPLSNAGEALSYAQHVIFATDGEAALTQQAPYVVEDEKGFWRVRGSRSRMPGVLDPVEVRLRKADATVLSYATSFMGGMKAPSVKSD